MESAADYSVVGADYDDVGPPIGEYEVPSQSDSLDFNTIANSTTLPATEKRPPPLPLETMVCTAVYDTHAFQMHCY